MKFSLRLIGPAGSYMLETMLEVNSDSLLLHNIFIANSILAAKQWLFVWIKDETSTLGLETS